MPSPYKLQVMDLNTWRAAASFTFDVNIRAPVFAANGRRIMVGDMSGHVYFFVLDDISGTHDNAVQKVARPLES